MDNLPPSVVALIAAVGAVLDVTNAASKDANKFEVWAGKLAGLKDAHADVMQAQAAAEIAAREKASTPAAG